MLWSIAEHLEDLRHFPSGPQVHPETGHGTPRGQADYTGSSERGRDGIIETLGQIFILCFKKKRMSESECGTAGFQIISNICDFYLQHAHSLLLAYVQTEKHPEKKRG